MSTGKPSKTILVLNIECKLSRDLIARLCWAGIRVTFDFSERQVVYSTVTAEPKATSQTPSRNLGAIF